jgi:hypothetical protein
MSRPSRIAIVKELGSRSPRCLAAHAIRGQDAELVVVERYPAVLGAEVLQALEDEAKELVPFEQANVATVIASVKLKGDVAILSEWVDGESLASVLSADQKPSFEMLLRVLSDAFEAMGALHAFGGRTCGALGVEDVFVGVDGVTRITRFGLGKISPSALGARRLASMAPEFLRGEKSPRGDVFTLGTLTWECFMGAPLFDTPANVDAQLAKLSSAPPRVDEKKRDAWAAPLADVIARALSLDPKARFATPAEFSKAIAAAVPGKIASRATVSQWVARVFGERIEARLVKLEPKVDLSFSVGAPPMSVPPADVAPPAPAKVPEIEQKIAETPKAKVVTPIADAKKPEVAIGEAKKPEPAKEKAPVAATAVAAAVRKPMQSTPEVAKKIVPLPKRAPGDPDSSPSLVAAAAKASSAQTTVTTPTKPITPTPVKTNGSGAVKADKIVAKAPPAKPKEEVAPVVPIVVDDEPAPTSNDLDSDIDLVSVRPPPMATKREEPKKEEAAYVAPKVIIAPAVDAPPLEIPRAPPAPRVSTRAVRDSDVNVYAKRSPYRAPLLFFVGVALAAGGFAAGRYTAPDAWPPTPTFSATGTPTPTPTHTETTPPPPTQTAGATSTTTSATATSAHPETHAIAPNANASPSASASKDGGRRYDPNGI